jgi:hypothetical protein
VPVKTCPACKKQSGPRTLQCECGHVFIKKAEPAAVAAATTPMTVDPLDVAIKDSLASVKTILKNAEDRGGQPPLPTPRPARPIVFTENEPEEKQPEQPEAVGAVKIRKDNTRFRTTYVPAGECPFKPEGFKDVNWSNGQASSAVVKNWATRVFNSDDRLHPHAVVYWARYYWNINSGAEWSRIRDLILDTLSSARPSHESIEDYKDEDLV